MVRRDRHDIVMDILKSTTSAKNKTEIMKAVNMSFLQAQQYLGALLKNELIEKLDSRHYKITTKGLDFLKNCGDCFLYRWHSQEKRKSSHSFDRKSLQ
jgi:predicted transcriptional regulator